MANKTEPFCRVFVVRGRQNDGKIVFACIELGGTANCFKQTMKQCQGPTSSELEQTRGVLA